MSENIHNVHTFMAQVTTEMASEYERIYAKTAEADQSHPTGKGFDPALVEETKTNIGFLLEMIEALAPVHYNGLKALCTA